MNRNRSIARAHKFMGRLAGMPAKHLSLALLLAACLCNTAEATLLYDFQQTGTGDVLATLELTSLPATHAEVVGLEFSPAGELFFGLPTPYPGTFTETDFSFINDGAGGLGSGNLLQEATILSHNPPTSPLLPGGGIRVGLLASDMPASDALGYASFEFPPAIIHILTTGGDWVLVPEPSTLALLVFGSVLVGSGAARRRRRCVR